MRTSFTANKKKAAVIKSSFSLLSFIYAIKDTANKKNANMLVPIRIKTSMPSIFQIFVMLCPARIFPFRVNSDQEYFKTKGRNHQKWTRVVN